MLKINKKVEYALMALKFLADSRTPDTLVSAREICEEFHTPFDTTAKVMQVMNNNNVLSSVKGIRGGYTLNKPLKEISYMELVRMIEGRSEASNICTNHKGTCDLIEHCNITTPVGNLNRKLNAFLEKLTLEELLQSHEFNQAKKTETHV